MLLFDWRRVLIYTHRWLGIAGGVLFLSWFLSGIVMMYAGMPSLTPEERLMRLPVLDLSSARVAPAEAARGAGLSGAVNDRAGRRLSEFVDWAKQLAMAGESTPPRELVNQLMVDIDYRDWLRHTSANTRAAKKRLENLDEFLSWLGHIGEADDGTPTPLADVVRRLSLLDFANQSEKDIENQVHLLTLHAAKGLEFDHVYLAGMEEGLLPHHACLDDERIEEERRLLYVGITRARKSLALTYARKRRRGGEESDTTPSRFLDELPREEIDWPATTGQRDKAAAATENKAQVAALRAMLGTGE